MWALAGVILSVFIALEGCTEPSSSTEDLFRAPAISNVVDGVVFEAGNWEPHLTAGDEGVSWGNHRAVVEVKGAVGAENNTPPEAVIVTIPWRRRDADPAAKGIIVVDAVTGEAVGNAFATRVENASGDVIFQPSPGSTTYHVYYMPWQTTGGSYPTVTYPTRAELRGGQPSAAAPGESPSRAQESRQSALSWAGKAPDPDPAWEERASSAATSDFPQARTTHIQSVDDFHSFFPMEVVATPEETAAFMAATAGPGGWALVPEHRDFPVRMRHFLPHHWVQKASARQMGADSNVSDVSAETFSSRVLRNEAFTFQLVLVSGPAPLTNIQVTFDGFPDSWREEMTCFNCGGTNEKGESFKKTLDVSDETLQPLWIGIQVPNEHPAGPVQGTITVSSENRGSQSVEVALEVRDGRAETGGVGEPDLQTRLGWLNSTVGTDPDFIIEPFEAVRVLGHSLSILGRRIDLGPTGLPDQIWSHFTPELTSLADEPEPILAEPLALDIIIEGGRQTFDAAAFEPSLESRGRAEWRAESTSDHFRMTVEGRLEYDGMLDYRVSLVALENLAVEEIALPIDLVPGAAEYMLGLGRKGGRRPVEVDWKWAVENHQEGVWLGGVHKGLQYVLRDENYVRPLNTNFYRNQPLNMPPSWFNGGRGGIRIAETGDAVTAYNYSGPRTLAAGDTLHFNIRFLITPLKPIDTKTHFNTRFVHQYVPVDSVKEWGGTVVNIHHANEINPFINYPFFNLDQQSAYIDEAHEKGIKVKLYNTIRELTYKAHELYPMRSFGDEILNDGEGGGHSWMQEHLESDYHSAWHASRVDDAAMLNKGTSRWTNYYVEGINWLAENQHIDGLYLDDIAFSRETVKRIVAVLYEHRDEVVIDLHSANQFNVRDGFTNSAMLYMEHFPFISRLWLGEYFEYDLDEDYWMTEVSGLPFGLMGEMLQDGGHPYRGMLFGMTARKYGRVDPRPVWAMMNDFDIAESEMKGYWLEDAPIRTDHPRIPATTYVRPDGILIALASWSEEDEVVSLAADWPALGLSPTARALAPALEGLQAEAEVDLSAVSVPAGQGLFLIVRPPEGI